MRLARTLLALVAAGCAAPSGELTLVESFPIETDLDHVDLPDTVDVWLDMLASASTTLELSHFYASGGSDTFESVVRAVEDAAQRGVRVRFLADERFYATYPETLDRLDRQAGIEVRRIDLRPVSGGVQHAKYMIVDGRETFVGSPNFDWRSLEHIQELGARIASTPFATAVGDVFEYDWALAGGEPLPARRIDGASFPVELALTSGSGAGRVRAWPALSPLELLPDRTLWDLPVLVRWIDEARSSVCAQVLTYRLTGYDGSPFPDLDDALRRAARRGVRVRLLVANWSLRAGIVEGLQDLARVPGIEVRFAEIPEWSERFVPYSRVVHAKLLVVDSERVWIGSSNWEKGYFDESRNVGVFLAGGGAGSRLEHWFEHTWEGRYARQLDPDGSYEPPRRE